MQRKWKRNTCFKIIAATFKELNTIEKKGSRLISSSDELIIKEEAIPIKEEIMIEIKHQWSSKSDWYIDSRISRGYENIDRFSIADF